MKYTKKKLTISKEDLERSLKQVNHEYNNTNFKISQLQEHKAGLAGQINLINSLLKGFEDDKQS